MAAAKYFLEHFYHGQLVIDGRVSPEPVLIGATTGITPDLVQAALETAQLPPLLPTENASWALVRGSKKLPFVMVQSQLGTVGQHVSHYVIMPSEVLRAVGGNVRVLMALVESEIPQFNQTGYRLKPLVIEQTEPESTAQQVDDILDLMTVVQNNLDVMERLLAGLVQGRQIVVQGAPAQLEPRTRFLQGLLALLPPSVRFAVTFATYSNPSTDIDVQVRFFSDDTPPSDALIFLWPTARLMGAEISDDYSRFVISQLRLDPSLVIARTRALTAPTGWRMRQGDRLADALAYGSYRLKVDDSLMNNLPVDKGDVAKILSTDPTLNENYRRAYALHLLKFSLAMDSIAQADPVLSVFDDYPDLESLAMDEIRAAPSMAAFKLIVHWLNQPNALQQKPAWKALSGDIALALVQELVRGGDAARLTAFIHTLSASGDATATSARVIVDLVMPMAVRDAALAEAVLIFASVAFDLPDLDRLMQQRAWVGNLRPLVRQAIGALNGDAAKPDVLLAAAQAVTTSHDHILITRWAELARARDHLELLTPDVLAAVARLAAAPDGAHFAESIRAVTARLTPDGLRRLGKDAAYQVLRARLALGDYAELASMMLQQSMTFYAGDGQMDYMHRVQRLFAETTITGDRLQRALTEIQLNGIKSAPLLMASLGAVEGRPLSPELNRIANRIEDSLLTDPLLVSVVPIDSILKLLDYHARAGAIKDAVRVADLVPLAAQSQHVNNLEVSSKMYRIMDRDETTRAAGLDILRVYVRGADDNAARQAIVYYGRELGAGVRSALQAAYYVSRLTNQDLVEFTQAVRVATLLLLDITSSYVRGAPELNDLNSGMQRLTGSYSLDERRSATRDILELGRQIVQLFQAHQSQRARDSAALFAAKADPNTALDLMRVVAGYFTDGRVLPLRFDTVGGFPLKERSRKVLKNEIEMARKLLRWLLDVMNTGKPANLSASEVHAELAAQLSMLDDPTRASVSRILAADLPRLVELLEFVASSGDAKVLEDGSAAAQKIEKGRQKPRSVLEFLRYLSAYLQVRG